MNMDVTQFKNNVEATFNDVSDRYDQNRFFAISASKMAEFVPFTESMNVLDVSTGTGVVALEVARKYRHAKVEGVDLSPGMLRQAAIKAKEEGLDNLSFIRCDAEVLPYGEAVFDVVTCGYALFFYPDMVGAFRAICKTLKSGGLFVFSSFTNDAFSPYAESFLHRLERDYKVEPATKIRERLKTWDQVNELVDAHRHSHAKVEYYPIRYSITVDEWWSLLNSAGYKSLLDQLDHDQLLRFKEDHLADIASGSSNGVIELNADTLYGLVYL